MKAKQSSIKQQDFSFRFFKQCTVHYSLMCVLKKHFRNTSKSSLKSAIFKRILLLHYMSKSYLFLFLPSTSLFFPPVIFLLKLFKKKKKIYIKKSEKKVKAKITKIINVKCKPQNCVSLTKQFEKKKDNKNVLLSIMFVVDKRNVGLCVETCCFRG